MHVLGRVWLLGLLGLATALAVDLGWQDRSLRLANQRLSLRLSQVHAGMYEPTFRATSMDGRAVVVGSADNGSRQVLFVFTTTCPYCRRTLSAWKRIAGALETLPDVKATAIGISLDSVEATRQYASHNGLAFPVVRFPEAKLAYVYRARSVPTTIVLDNNGRVTYARVGFLDDSLLVDSVVAAVRWRPGATKRLAHAAGAK